MSSGYDEFERIVFIHGLLKREVSELMQVLERAGRDIAESDFPHMDVSQLGDILHITVELPGVSLEDFTLYLYEDMLVIEGTKSPEKIAGKVHFHRMERHFAPFRRVVHLPFPADAGGIEARLKDGILHVNVRGDMPFSCVDEGI